MSMKNLGLFAAMMSSIGLGDFINGKTGRTTFNPNKERSNFWDKKGRKTNKLNLTTCEQESLLGLHGKPKKEFLKQLKAA